MTDLTNICLPCGFCCDGTLIGYVQLDKDELPILRELMDIEEENGEGFFLQPCSKHCDVCTIYAKRSKKCNEFNCGLLKSVEQKDCDFASAIEIINVIKLQKNAIEEKLLLLNINLKSKSFHFKMIELNILLQKNKSSLSQKHLELISMLEKLDTLLKQKFGVSLY